MIEVNCPTCGKTLRIADEYAGQAGRCNGCQGIVHVPKQLAEPDDEEDWVSVPTTRPGPPPLKSPNSVEIVEAVPKRDWRDEPPSERQLSTLADLGATPTQMRVLTKGQASELIEVLQKTEPPSRAEVIVSDMAHSQREMAKAQKDLVNAAKQHTNWQKNACGCLLLLLLAPIWIPSCLYIIGSSTSSDSGSYTPSSRPSTNGRSRSEPRPLPQNKITLAKFNQLREGMSYREVVDILGEEGTVMSENTIGSGQYRVHTVMYTWEAGFMANMNAMFQNGGLISKAQFGLR